MRKLIISLLATFAAATAACGAHGHVGPVHAGAGISTHHY